MGIQEADAQHYQELIEIWQASVQATHDFLADGEIAKLRPLILEHYFDAVKLHYFAIDDGKIVGFIGVADANIEMLFVAPEFIGQGIGRALCEFALTRLGAKRVDVNEQNPNAIRFYKNMGFEEVGRSDLDGQGNPYPLIHMALVN